MGFGSCTPRMFGTALVCAASRTAATDAFFARRGALLAWSAPSKTDYDAGLQLRISTYKGAKCLP